MVSVSFDCLFLALGFCFALLLVVDDVAAEPAAAAAAEGGCQDISKTAEYIVSVQHSSGFLQSYEAQPDAFWATNRSYAYSNACAVIGLLLHGDPSTEAATKDLLTAIATHLEDPDPPYQGKMCPFSWSIKEPYWVGWKSRPYRTGAHAWVTYAFALYELLTGDLAFAETIDQLTDFLLSMANTECDQGCPEALKGGPDVEWQSTEHNIDAYFALDLVGYLRGNPDLRETATHFSGLLTGSFPADGVWNEYWGKMTQGYGDPTDPLDTQSWGGLFLLGARSTHPEANERVQRLMEYHDLHHASEQEVVYDGVLPADMGGIARGYKPWNQDDVYNVVWSEGTYGVAILADRFQSTEAGSAIREGLIPMIRDDGAVLYASQSKQVSKWGDKFWAFANTGVSGWRLMACASEAGRANVFWNATDAAYEAAAGTGFQQPV